MRSGETPHFGGERTHNLDGLNAVGNTVLSVLRDQGVVGFAPEAYFAGARIVASMR